MELTRRHFIASSAALMAASMAVGQNVPPREYRACIIGDTKQGEYGHSLHVTLALRQDIHVLAVADPDEAGRQKHMAEAKAARGYADYREMLEKEKPDIVVVAPRWTIHHREYLEACAEVGAHGFMEKPVADTLADADAMIQVIEAKNLKWALGYNFRVLPIVQHARKLVSEGLVGEVLEMRGRGKEDHRAGGEDLLVLGTHIFDLMRFFVGDAQWCFSDITVDGRPATKADVHEATEPLGPVVGDRISAMYGFKDGIKGYFASAKTKEGGGGRWGLDIYGSKGVVSIRQDVKVPIHVLFDPAWSPGGRDAQWQPLPDAPDAPAQPDPLNRYLPIMSDLLVAIEEDRIPQVSLQDGRASLEMGQAVYESFVRKAPVTFPLERRDHPLKRWV
ncbi:MAG: Gfo/Idh/MocA family oxidoreductase [FCB group bacterium]|jgi:predicted dehydrogenase|nr:Gfo/Idh/MocA family oxidoreductase [FCB group bacterium]